MDIEKEKKAIARWWVGDDPAQLSFFEGDDYY